MTQAAPDTTPSYRILCDTSDEQAWLAHRVAGIGASEISCVLGVSKWKGRLGLYYDKIDPPAPEPMGEWLEWGKLLEGVILDELSRRAGVTYRWRQMLLQSLALPWAIATPDAMTKDGEPVEVKNLAWGYHEDEWEEQIPEPYLLQCQHQMLITDADRCLFGALTHGQAFVWEWVPRDNERIARIITAGTEFWRRVTEKDPPPSDGHPTDRNRLSSLDHDGDAVELYHDDELDQLLAQYETRRSMRLAMEKDAKRMKTEEEAAANQIAQRLGNAQRGFTADGYEFTWKESQRKGYTVEPTTLRKFKIKEPK